MKKIVRVLCLLVCLEPFWVTWGWAQATTSLTGTVLDARGAVVPRAKITLSNPDTGLVRAAASGPDGVYEFRQLMPGTYALSVEAEGFRKFESQGLNLLVNTPATVNVTLEVGSTTQTVAVT